MPNEEGALRTRKRDGLRPGERQTRPARRNDARPGPNEDSADRQAARTQAMAGRAGSSGRPTPASPDTPAEYKEPFDIHEVFRRLRAACAGLPKAAMFQLRDEGYRTPYEQLVASLISARTLDETTIPVCRRLFARARTPAAMAALGEADLVGLLRGATFPEPKARDILALSRTILERFGGAVPDTLEGLTAFRGVGPKVAALTLAVGFNKPAICVDVHVHRVTNRWGYVAEPTPERSMVALASKLPREYWIEINERLVPFGKHICTGLRPKCPICPLLSMCRQVGGHAIEQAGSTVADWIGTPRRFTRLP